LFYTGAEFSSDIDRQNSVFSKPLSGQSRMINGYKAGRDAQVLVFNSRTNSFGNSSVFAFLLTAVPYIQISVFALSFGYGVSDILSLHFRWS
jgi:hypothetical protein